MNTSLSLSASPQIFAPLNLVKQNISTDLWRPISVSEWNKMFASNVDTRFGALNRASEGILLAAEQLHRWRAVNSSYHERLQRTNAHETKPEWELNRNRWNSRIHYHSARHTRWPQDKIHSAKMQKAFSSDKKLHSRSWNGKKGNKEK